MNVKNNLFCLARAGIREIPTRQYFSDSPGGCKSEFGALGYHFRLHISNITIVAANSPNITITLISNQSNGSLCCVHAAEIREIAAAPARRCCKKKKPPAACGRRGLVLMRLRRGLRGVASPDTECAVSVGPHVCCVGIPVYNPLAGSEASTSVSDIESPVAVDVGGGGCYDTDMLCFTLGVEQDVEVTGANLARVSNFTSGSAGLTEDSIGDQSCPAAAAHGGASVQLGVYDVELVGDGKHVSALGACGVFATIAALVVPSGAIRILLLQVGENTQSLLNGDLALVTSVLAGAIVVLVVVLIARVVVVNQLEQANDDGASLRTGHVAGAAEGAIGVAHDDAGSVAVFDSGLVCGGNLGPVGQGCHSRVLLGGGVLENFTLIAEDVLDDHSHFVTVDSVVGDRDGGPTALVYDVGAGVQANVTGSLSVRIVPGLAGGVFDSLDLSVVEGAGQHDQELDVGHVVVGLEGAIGVTGDDAQLGALGNIRVIPGGGLDVLEGSNQRNVILGHELGIGEIVIRVVEIAKVIIGRKGIIRKFCQVNGIFGLCIYGCIVGILCGFRNIVIEIFRFIAVAVVFCGKSGSHEAEAHDKSQEQGNHTVIKFHWGKPLFHKIDLSVVRADILPAEYIGPVLAIVSHGVNVGWGRGSEAAPPFPALAGVCQGYARRCHTAKKQNRAVAGVKNPTTARKNSTITTTPP